jgi:hypothetical protein
MTKLNIIGGQKPNPVGKQRKLYLYEGEHRSVYAIAKMRGEPNSSVAYRFAHGIDLDAKPYATSLGPKRKQLLYNGESMTAAEIAQETGYSISTVLRRNDGVRFFPRGEPTDPFEEWPIIKGQYNEEYELNGIKDTLKGWAKRAGLNYYTLRGRLRLHSNHVALAIKAPVATRTERKANARIVAKMAALFKAAGDGTASAARTASAASMATGGRSQTLPEAPPTGPLRTNHDLLGV